MLIYFSDFFNVDPALLEEYGSFNVSLINDLPLFIDPFLLFESKHPEYHNLHDGMIKYLRFLRDVASAGPISDGLLWQWFIFKEVKENWLGYSRAGNRGSGLGRKFARALYANLQTVFSSFGNEHITRDSHLEKLCLIDDGVGRDNISDFTVNLIKGYLLEYTQEFARQHIDQEFCRVFGVERVQFNYSTKLWRPDKFYLPTLDGRNYVILTPKDMLTRHEAWISRHDLLEGFYEIPTAIPDEQLRAQIDFHFRSQLTENPKDEDKERANAWLNTIRHYPVIIDYYIRDKEDHGDRAATRSSEYVVETERQFIAQVQEFVKQRLAGSEFYSIPGDTLEEARQRVYYLKHVIEHNDGYRFFYFDGEPIRRETDLHLLYRLTWCASPSDVNSEVNNGRGPVDYKISRGSCDTSLVEFKLARNTKLKQNLKNQVLIYEEANQTKKSLKVIVFFSADEEAHVKGILRELDLDGDPDIILIDARADNKPSGSNA